jgi:hypothetical protein
MRSTYIINNRNNCIKMQLVDEVKVDITPETFYNKTN